MADFLLFLGALLMGISIGMVVGMIVFDRK